MKRGRFLARQRWRIFLDGFMILIVTMGLYGCLPPATPSLPIVCTPVSPNVNIYRTTPQTWANLIFQYAYPSVPQTVSADTVPPMPLPQDEQRILGARYEAFLFLKNQTTRWSDIETIKLDDSNEVQIAVTFISPELIQAVFLNEVLKGRFLTADFDIQLQEILNILAARDELLFLITVTSTSNNNINAPPHVIDMPISEMKLNNAGNLESTPNHDDHNLDQPIDPSSEPVFGYIAYPLAILQSGGCAWVLDPKYNTNIVITVPDIKIDNLSSHPYTWTIPYQSLIDPNIPPDPPTFIMPPDFNQEVMSPFRKPPHPTASLRLSSGADPNIYWQDFARYVWHQITLGNY